MSRMDQPTADDVILDLLVDGVEPTHENLIVAIAAYPQHRDALVAFFANLAAQTALKDEMTPSECSAEQFANIGVSRVLAHRHDALRQASTNVDRKRGEHEAEPLPARLSQLIRVSGLTEDQVAVRVGLDSGLMMKLDRRRIVGRRPMEMFRRIADELRIPPAHVIASVTGAPIASSRGNLRKAKEQIRIETETFEAAIKASTLSDDLKAFWLQRLADEDEATA
jgi:transcriptional regulator with XRE-family HTH domain